MSLLLLLALAVPGFSQADAQFYIQLLPATTTPAATEPMQLGALVKYPDGYQVRLDTSSQAVEPFMVVGLERLASELQDGRRTDKWLLTALPLALGATEFPALDWQLSGPAGDKTLHTAAIPLNVVPPQSVVENPDLMPLRGPLGERRSRWWWALLAAVVLVALAAAYWLRKRRKKPGEPDAPPEPDLPPEEEALRAVDALLASGLWEKGDMRGFYGRLSEIVRRYLERRQDMPATYMTTSDILRQLRKNGVERGGLHAVREVLEACDLAKFAKAKPTLDERDKDIAKARRVFTPPPEPPQEKALAAQGRGRP